MKVTQLIIASVLLLFLSNEIVTLLVIGAWGFAGLTWLLKAAAKGGAFN